MNLRGLCAGLLALTVTSVLPVIASAEGALKARTADGRERGLFPLVRTDVHASISGEVTEVTVSQRFHNPYAERIEAVYVFPLPDDAAVDELEMHLGSRTVRAVIERRGEARARYDTAVSTGHRAALLEQERPNIFTLSVANVEPGTEVEVRLRYFALARYDHGTYEMVFPMVVGPRYVPGDPIPGAPSGRGTHPDTDRVPDASRISPPYAPPGVRAGHSVGLAVHLDTGTPIGSIDCPAHDVEIRRDGSATADVSLRDKDEIPNRDFILRWSLAAPTLRTAVLPYRPDAHGEGYVAVLLEPRHDPPPGEIAPRELVFLLDTSGSMQGPPLDTARAAVRRALTTMGPADTFTLIDFADNASTFSPAPLPNTPENVANALAYLDHLSASGGTNQLAGIHAALGVPGDPMRLRYVVFLTDGYIGNESEVIALTRREIGAARIFSFGIGSSVNRYLLDEVAVAGRGVAEYLRPGEAPEAMVERFYTRIGQPWLTDIEVDWGGLAVRDVEPAAPPDLSALQPLVLLARYTVPGSGTVTLRGRVGGRPFAQEIPVTLPATESAHGAIGGVWARARIATLTREEHLQGHHPELAETITGLALAHHLVSQYTSLVAVDEDLPGDPSAGAPRRVIQPVDGPEGVNVQSAGGAVSNGAFGATGVGWGGGGVGMGTIGLGNLGTVGGAGGRRGVSAHGGGGGIASGPGVGHGTTGLAAASYGGMAMTGVGYGSAGTRGLAPRVTAAPVVTTAAPMVQGSLSPEVIRRVVLHNMGQVQRCYAQGLAVDPTLAGRITVRFVLGVSGAVTSSVVQTSDLAQPSVGACIAAAVRGWIFPVPVGGTVTVTYPFTLAPAAVPAVPARRTTARPR